MGFNRIVAKQTAKQNISKAVPSPLLVTLAFLLLTTGISIVIDQLRSDPITEAAEFIYQWGYDPEEVMEYLFQRNAKALGIYAIVSFLFFLYSTVINFGYTSYTLRLARGENPSIYRLFDGFFRFGRVLWLSFLTECLIGLWGALGTLPGVLLLLAGSLTKNYLLIAGSALILVAGMGAVMLWATLRYALAPFFLLDDPSCSPRDAITRSRKTMRGWKIEYFLLLFSFFGWYILSGLTGAIAQEAATGVGAPGWLGIIAGSAVKLWLCPYVACTQANFYDAVAGRFQVPPSVGGYTSNYGNYSSGSGEGPFPF